jgi:RimJ/RimL family protein N-acetyltransferase
MDQMISIRKAQIQDSALIFDFIKKLAKYENLGRVEWWVLDWNKPSIDFYKSLGAKAMDEWTVFRITEDKFEGLTLG